MAKDKKRTCNLFVGYRIKESNVQALFDEYEDPDDMDELDEDPPNCLAAELLGFSWYDHDWIDYETTKKPLPPEEFFADKKLQRIAKTWEIPSLSELVKACEKLKSGPINFVAHIGDDYLNKIKPGKRAEIKGKEFIMYLGAFKG